ncbi:MAG: capsular biosynthesis protein [Oceanospirillaceae bacterium]|nr:capsular biosynthesis protein [Oceanospirillaceae bacterium]
MIDLHNHLLPGIDDGAPDIDASLELARMAVAEGITHMVCTPHIHPGRYDNTPDTIAAALKRFNDALGEAGIPLQASAAAEVRFGLELMAGVADGKVPFLGEWEGHKVMLLEFPHSEIPFGAERLTQWLKDRKILPMIAHPERNKGVMRQPSRLRPFIEQGCLLQVTASSVTGHFGDAARDVATELLRQDRVTVLATDAHNRDRRPPRMRDAVTAAESIIGAQRAAELVTLNPWKIALGHFE